MRFPAVRILPRVCIRARASPYDEFSNIVQVSNVHLKYTTQVHYCCATTTLIPNSRIVVTSHNYARSSDLDQHAVLIVV